MKRGEKTVSRRDLAFTDGDSDFEDADLAYHFPEPSPHGGFYWARLPAVPVANFTQGDVDEGRLLFRHLGDEPFFKLPFYVSDGLRSAKDEFEVEAAKVRSWRHRD